MIVALFIVLALFLLPDFYICFQFLRGSALVWRFLFFLPTFLGLASLVGMRYCGFSSAFGTLFLVSLLCFAFPKFCFALVSLIGKLLGVWSAKAFLISNSVGVVAAGAVALMALYGLVFGWKHLETKYVDLYFDSLPQAFDGYRIAHLSDLHVGTHGEKTAFVDKVVRRVNEEHPDLIVFTGDIVNTEPEELLPFTAALSQLSAPDGVASVLGNHDYCLYGNPDRWADVRAGGHAVAAIERSMGWHVLMNESLVLRRDSARIAVAGVENTGKPPFPEMGDLMSAVNGVTGYGAARGDRDLFTVLLTHDPSHWRMEVLPETDIPLTLSGHTHAAQFKIGKWSPSGWLYKEWGGAYESNGQQLFISEGLGGTLPFRFGTRPQVVVLTLHRTLGR